MSKLILVGSGIKSVAHITQETQKVIQSADKVLYLVNEDLLKEWIQREAKHAESLEPIYFGLDKRADAYHQIAAHIIDEYQRNASLCVVFYGHPTVFADAGLSAVRQIRANGGDARILPAISSLDCLFSDLAIDPGDQGCFCVDATELLVYERRFDVSSHLIIWQSANLGTSDSSKTNKLSLLRDYLLNYYPSEQQLCIYEAALLPMQSPRVEWLSINELGKARFSYVSTLYLPPLERGELSQKYLSLLDMNVNDFTV